MEDESSETSPRNPAPVLSIVAIVLSVGALLVSVFEVSAIRDEQRTQVWPYLSIATQYSSEGFRLVAANKGIGPARVRQAVLTFDGEAVDDLDALILETLGEEDAFSYDLYRVADISRSVLSPDESKLLFGVPWEPRTRRLTQAWNGRLGFAVCYCSVYDDCWRSTLNGGEPDVVDACPIP